MYIDGNQGKWNQMANAISKRTDKINNRLAISDAWITLFHQNKRAPEHAELATYTGYSPRTIQRHLSEMDFSHLIKNSIYGRVAEVAQMVADKAIQDKDLYAASILLKYFPLAPEDMVSLHIHKRYGAPAVEVIPAEVVVESVEIVKKDVK